MNHSPGPWSYLKQATVFSICDRKGKNVASVVHKGGPARAKAEPDCRLIAAAPDMLAALKNVAEGWGDDNEVLNAIAKATGETGA